MSDPQMNPMTSGSYRVRILVLHAGFSQCFTLTWHRPCHPNSDENRDCNKILWTVERKSLSIRERTSFVAVPQTEDGRVLSWKADNFLHVSPCISDVRTAFSPRVSRLDAQWIDLWVDVFIKAIRLVVAEVLSFQSKTNAKVGAYQPFRQNGVIVMTGTVGNDQLPFANFWTEGLCQIFNSAKA